MPIFKHDLSKPPEHPRTPDIQTLWAKYEDIAMHFNDLLMRLRLQSLAGIAALSTIVGFLTRGGESTPNWLGVTALFVGIAFFWIAIWCLDFLYYNTLLRGAVRALLRIEEESRKGADAKLNIELSTLIEAEFARPITVTEYMGFRGVLLFYFIVLLVIVSGAAFCLHMYLTDP